MNEFADAGAIDRLIGTHYHPQGILTERVRYTQSCVLLLDEIEKAHPRVHDLLLQLLDDGRLTDASGRTTDFTQSIVVMTSNVGAQEAASSIGFGSGDRTDGATYMRSLEQYFRPELINRINNTVLFNSLQLGDMTNLAHLHLSKLLKRDGFTRRKTILNVDQLCLDALARWGYDPTLGARALKRNLEKSLTRMTAAKLAQITTKNPIILNVQLVQDIPTTSITQLHYASTQEQPLIDVTPVFDHSRYTELLQQLEHADEVLAEFTRGNNESLQHVSWRLSGGIRDISQPLQRYLWEQEERKNRVGYGKPFVFRMPRVKLPRDIRNNFKVDVQALSAKHDMKDYLREVHQHADNAIQEDLHHQLRLVSESSLLIHAATKLAERGIDRGVLKVTPLNNETNTEKLVQSLVKRYSSLIDEKLGAVESTSQRANTTQLLVSGCGLFELLDYESGVHLFMGENFRQVPVEVHFVQQADSEQQSETPDELEVIRLYTLNNTNDGYDDIVDLRLGLSSQAVGIEEHVVLLYPATQS